MDNSEWQKHGRDAAREDIAGGAPPCTTIAEARVRIRAWITTDSWQPDTVAITADEAEACAAAYLATWQARAGTAPDNTSPAGLDLDAIEARHAAAQWPETMRVHDDGDVFVEAGGGDAVACMVQRHERWPRDERAIARADSLRHLPADVLALVARVRDLTAKLDATAQAFDDLVAQVWRATGETHEPPADVAALLRRVAEEHKALVGFRRAMLDVHEALDGVRPEPDFDMPAELGSYACDEVARLKAAVLPAGHVAVDRALYEAACRLAADVPRLQREVADARREGAEAMREACAERADETAALCDRRAESYAGAACGTASGPQRVAGGIVRSLAASIRALPLPGGEP